MDLLGQSAAGRRLHLEGGNHIIGWDGQRADKVSIRTVPADRLPVRPLPPGSQATTVYMFYFGKRGGGIPPGETNPQPTPAADPVDLSTGIFMLSATDLVLPGRLPVAITRSYRSGDPNSGVFGLGTMMGYEEYLQMPR